MNLYYLGKGKNFGDAINAPLFNELFNQNVKRARYYNAHYFAIGSILSKAFYDTPRLKYASKNIKRLFYSSRLKNQPIHILGSGFVEDVRQTRKTLTPFRPLNIVGLRGHKTKEIMEGVLGQSLEGIAIGDPGLLVSDFIQTKPIEKKYRLGIIPHVVDQESEILSDFIHRPDTRILNIKSAPADFLQSLAECETVASSTLHGLITADSLHVPSLWIKLSDKIYGHDFKFHDHYSIYGIEPNVTDLRSTPAASITPEYVLEKWKIPPQDVEALKKNIRFAFQTFFETH